MSCTKTTIIASIGLIMAIATPASTVAALNVPETPKVSSNAMITTPGDSVGLRSGATNVAIEAFNRCRYLDNASSNDFFIPLRTAIEWEAFIQRAPLAITVSHCRPAHSITYDFSSAALPPSQRLTAADGVVSQGNGYTDTALHSGVFQRSFNFPLARAQAYEAIETNLVTYSRRDCRLNRTSTGALRNPPELCSTAMWTETGQVRVRYTPPSGSARGLGNDLGSWTTEALDKLGAPPPYAPPENRACPPAQHGERQWHDHRTQTRGPTAGECPHGPGSQTYQRTEQLEYLCFDGVLEPTGAARYTPWQSAGGSCEPPTAGAWTVEDWGACSAPCGGGVQTRAVTCAFDSCLGDAPVTSQSCNQHSCSAEAPPTSGPWTVEAWGACSAPCGGGVQTRAVTCAFDSCLGDAPVTSQSCNEHSCGIRVDGQCGGSSCATGEYIVGGVSSYTAECNISGSISWYSVTETTFTCRGSNGGADASCFHSTDQGCSFLEDGCPHGSRDVIYPGECGQWDTLLLGFCVPENQLCNAR